MEIELQGFTAVLDELTRTTYIMIIVHDTTIGGLRLFFSGILNSQTTETEAIKMNIRLARPKFEALQKMDNES